MNRFITTASMTALSFVAQTSFANLPLIRDNQTAVVLYADNNRHVVRYMQPYPGKPIPGDPAGEKIAPDCLVVGKTSGIPQAELDKLLNELAVASGPNILMGRRVSDIPAARDTLNGTPVFYLKDLDKYVTGIEIRTKDQRKSFGEVLRENLGENAPEIPMTLSLGCKAAR